MKFIEVNHKQILRFSSINRMEVFTVKHQQGHTAECTIVFHMDDKTKHESSIIGHGQKCRKVIRKLIESDSTYVDLSQYESET